MKFLAEFELVLNCFIESSRSNESFYRTETESNRIVLGVVVALNQITFIQKTLHLFTDGIHLMELFSFHGSVWLKL